MNTSDDKIRVLQVVPNMQAGGLENLIMNFYRKLDRSKFQFDFIVHYTKPNFFDEEIKKMGGHIYYLSLREDWNLLKYIKDLINVFKTGKYRIVHSHMASLAFVHLGVAKFCGVENRIVHSHNSSSSTNVKGRVKALLLKLAPIFANKHFACSQSAGRFLYGKKTFHVVHNAIELEKFKYSEQHRLDIRREFGIDESTIVVGHIGRFNVQKNHSFLLKIFAKCLEKNKNMMLVLVGDGELRSLIENQIAELKIEKNVVLAGIRKDTERFYSAFDVFVMPSFFEGLPVTGVEAQAANLPCVFSDAITCEVELNSNARFVPLSCTLDEWSNVVLASAKFERNVALSDKLSLYDDAIETRRLEKEYLGFLN